MELTVFWGKPEARLEEKRGVRSQQHSNSFTSALPPSLYTAGPLSQRPCRELYYLELVVEVFDCESERDCHCGCVILLYTNSLQSADSHYEPLLPMMLCFLISLSLPRKPWNNSPSSHYSTAQHYSL
ncbi:hypothetical protein MHYP_G00236360 [Metynnis hypsauchen]